MSSFWHHLWRTSPRPPRASRPARPRVEVLEDRLVPSGGIQEFPIPTAGSGPVGITAGPDGAIWFTENATSQIGRITTAGVVTNEFAIPTNGADPDGIVAGPDGALWFTEFFGNKIGRITTSGIVTNEFPIQTSNANPAGIAIGSDDNLWFVEEQGGKVGRITTAGIITEFNLAAGSRPIGIVSGPDHNLWVTESGTGKIAVLDTNGILINQFSVASAGASPQGITLGSDSNLWFTEQGTDKIGRITTAGVLTEFPLASGAAPEGIAPGPDGALWFSEGGAGKVGRITTAGALTEYATPTSASHPVGITSRLDGTLWFAERDVNQIGRLMLDQPLAAIGLSVSASAGVPFFAAVTTLSDADLAAVATSFQTTIAWGDGASSAGILTRSGPGTFTISGGHTYQSQGAFLVTVTITDVDTSHDIGGNTASSHAMASVALSNLPGFTGTPNQRYVARLYLDLLGRGPDALGLPYWTGLLDRGMSRFQLVRRIEASLEYRVREAEGLYQRYLGRPADPGGLQVAVGYLNTGLDPSRLIAFFLSCPEYAARHGITDNVSFAATTFQDVLGRPLDAPGRVLFARMLNTGMSRQEFASDLLHSAEALGNRVTQMYAVHLNRAPEAAGFMGWLASLQRGMSADVLTAGFAASQEFFADS